MVEISRLGCNCLADVSTNVFKKYLGAGFLLFYNNEKNMKLCSHYNMVFEII